MQSLEVSEKIKVGAVFENAKVIPKWFVRGTHKTVLQSVEFTWRSRIGEVPWMHFSASDGANVFELRFNLKTTEWFLEKILSA